MTREEIDLMYDHWLANNQSAIHFYDCHGFGREAWHAAFASASSFEAVERDKVLAEVVDRISMEYLTDKTGRGNQMTKEECERWWRIYGKAAFTNPPTDPTFEDFYQAIYRRLFDERALLKHVDVVERPSGDDK